METTRTRVLCLVLSLAPCGSFEHSAGPTNIPYFFTSIRARGVVRQRSVQTLLPPSSPAFFHISAMNVMQRDTRAHSKELLRSLMTSCTVRAPKPVPVRSEVKA